MLAEIKVITLFDKVSYVQFHGSSPLNSKTTQLSATAVTAAAAAAAAAAEEEENLRRKM